MPPRISRPAGLLAQPSSAKPQGPAKKRSRKRVLDAFAIASHQVNDSVKVRRSRLGQAEEDPRDRKRRRAQLVHDDEEDEGAEESEDESAPRGRHKRQRSGADVENSEAGSDSEGNAWTMGARVGAEDDSEIDSDEAFSDGDEQRFAHLAFGGSKVNIERRAAMRAKRKHASSGLDEDDDEDEDEDDSLGEDAVDLAQMLDEYSEGDEASDASDKPHDGAAGGDSSDDPGDESGDELPSDEDSSLDSADSEDEQDVAKLGRLQSLVSSLHPRTAEESKAGPSAYESMVPSSTGIVNKEKFDIRAILESSGDAQLAKVSKSVGVIPPKVVKKDPKLAPALPRRQKEKLDRIAANEKAKETLDRWTDSVKQMRRANHLTFPLQDSDAKAAHDTGYMLPAISGQPVNQLEATINSILQESGLSVSANKDQPFDTLPENNKASLEEVMAKRADLRRARDLIFREEQRSKRIKKIKSKSYRRVHRKERERLAELDKNAFEEEFGEMDEEEREAHDRRRAQERMGAKHRDSKWAKQMKKSGRSIWDDEAKSGVSDMARRNEELRRRMAGKTAADNSGDESSSSEDGPSDEDEPTFQLRQLRQKLSRLQEEDDNAEETGLAAMKFMQKAEAGRKARNEDDIRRMVKEMNGEESDDASSDHEAASLGRKIFGPASQKKAVAKPAVLRQEFEELEDSAAEDLEDDTDAPLIGPSQPSATVVASRSATAKVRAQNGRTQVGKDLNSSLAGKQGPETANTQIVNGERHSAPDTDGWITVTYDKEADASQASDVESEVSQAEILRKAFAGDDVEADFEAEKKATIAEEDEKVLDKTLPGWGSWTGEGISKREQKRNKGKVLVKQAGIRPQDRKDAGLKGVIINQKRLKKNLAYMANALPFPFTSQTEYDRSIRMPIGKEWNVGRTYGENTKPRVIVKPGQVVRPMSKPLV